jgi:Fur family ferric uptake transcriptional regulator
MPEQRTERKTKQRDAIKSAIERAGVPISPKEILESAQSHVAGLGLATVYRTLKILADEGLIACVEIPGEAPRYELAGKGHHHHFYCKSCGKVSEVHGCPGDFSSLAPKGYRLDGHELVLFGQCNTCAKRKRA